MLEHVGDGNNSEDGKSQEPPRKRRRENQPPNLKLKFISQHKEVAGKDLPNVLLRELPLDQVSQLAQDGNTERRLFGRPALWNLAVFNRIGLPGHDDQVSLPRFVSRALLSIAALPCVPNMVVTCQPQPHLLPKGQVGTPMLCTLLSGQEVGMFVVPPSISPGPWLGAAILNELPRNAAGRLTLVETDGTLLWQDLPADRIDLQALTSRSFQTRLQAKDFRLLDEDIENSIENTSSDLLWQITALCHPSQSNETLNVTSGAQDGVPSGGSPAAGGVSRAASSSDHPATSRISSPSTSIENRPILADVLGLTDRGLHVRPQGGLLWYHVPRDCACWLRAGDQIAVLLADKANLPAKHDTFVEDVTCLVGLEVLPLDASS